MRLEIAHVFFLPAMRDRETWQALKIGQIATSIISRSNACLLGVEGEQRHGTPCRQGRIWATQTQRSAKTRDMADQAANNARHRLRERRDMARKTHSG